ncbi:MAG: helix-turn-helix domain-containing protein [Caldilineaceae bacterium]
MNTETQINHSERIKWIEQYIRQHVHRQLTREELAQAAGYSIMHFHRIFFTHVSEPISVYVRRVRLELAARQLLESNDTVINIALVYGYETHSAFGRAFKEYFGISPTAFRQLHPQAATYLISRRLLYKQKNRKDEPSVKRILLTGMSGTGVSTVLGKLAACGFKTVDTDYDGYSEWVAVDDDSAMPGESVEPNRDWVWRADRIQKLLSTEDTDTLFLGGCSPNMRQFLPQFDHVILFSAPAEVLVERLRTRTNNPYGKEPEEMARVLGLVETVEPLLRRAADFEIDTSVSLEEVVETVLAIVRDSAGSE